jgi:YfiR/HmsC-like
MVAASRRRLLVLCLGGMLLAAGGAARGDQSTSGSLSEYKIKAAYLYYFTTFVDWPSETYARTGETLVIGVLGEDPFGAVLDETLRGKSVNNRRLVARRFASIKEARDSHILFISASERDRLPSILKALEGSAVLTVGDLDQFASRGGQIAFRTEDKKVRFDINVAAVERAHLKISAQLMKLGRIVDGSGREGV